MKLWLPMNACLFVAAGCLQAAATEQVYRPVNPQFGGNPLNGAFLMQQAQAQGFGAKSGQQGPDLSGLNEALANIGNSGGQAPIVVIGGNGLPVVPASP